LPICFLDHRRWHWGELRFSEHSFSGTIVATVALLCSLQLAFIYGHASIGKMFVPEWANGTALFYWAHHPSFGAVGFIREILDWIFCWDPSVTLVTWAVMLTELYLAGALFYGKENRNLAFRLGVMLHLGILALHGLLGFVLIMLAALIFYLKAFESNSVEI
jgi:antimicrobial peptide system SdpB family protein